MHGDDPWFGPYRLDHPYPNHLPLLSGLLDRQPARPDGLVIPSHRPLDGLDRVLAFGAELGTPVVVLWTDRTRSAEAPAGGRTPAMAPSAGIPWAVVVRWPDPAPEPWRARLSSNVFAAARSRNLEAGQKRNLGLQLAQLLGWRTVLFVDDDIDGISAADVKQAVGGMGAGTLAVWRMPRFPDNSVVCHAARAVGADQDVFLGTPLLVRLDDRTAFFPPVYNEDWLFCHDALRQRTVRYVADGVQDPFDPFDDPDRARQEEFGDVLAEALMVRLHLGLTLRDVDLPFWRAALRHRRWLLDAIEETLPPLVQDGAERDRIVACLAAARDEHRHFDAGTLHEFVRTWRADLVDWRKHLVELGKERFDRALPYPDRLSAALTALGWPDSEIVWASWL